MEAVMKAIEAYIESKQQEFIQHPFFKKLEELQTLEEISFFVPELTFWAMTFQDILRINEEKVNDPYLKKVARHHRMEDAGHEKWFLQDKQYLSNLSSGVLTPRDDVAWLYSKDLQVTRDAAYSILAEIYKIDDEILNVVLLLTLESSGHIFFEKVASRVSAAGGDNDLKYFSSTHLEAEKAHAIFEEEMEKNLFERTLSVDTRRKALQMIDRCYVAFNNMFDGLVTVCNHRLELANERNAQHGQKAVDRAVTEAM